MTVEELKQIFEKYQDDQEVRLRQMGSPKQYAIAEHRTDTSTSPYKLELLFSVKRNVTQTPT